MRFLLALCLCLPCLLCAKVLQTADDWPAVLHHIAQTMGDAVSKSDNYICAQDLSRFYYVAVAPVMACRQPPTLPSTPLLVQDRLKLDVAVSQGGEIYSWHGERKFSASSVSEVVQEGPISSGSFSGYLRNIFGERGVVFHFRGRSKVKEVELFQFDYQVPLASSHYEIQAGKQYELAPFHGSFAAKTDTFELYSLTVTANGEMVSPKTNICAAETRLTYQLVNIADHKSLLPASFDLLIGSRSGTFTESKGVYSGCREYRGESTVKFDMDDTATGTPKPARLQSEPLTIGLILPVVLSTEIDEDTAYAGLPVEAVLRRDVKIGKGEKLSRGATLRGTVTQFDIFHQPFHSVSLKLEFNDVTDGNKLYLCDAVAYDALSGFVTANMGGRGRGRGTAPSVQPSAAREPTNRSLLFEVKHLHLRKFDSELITVNHASSGSR